MLAFGRQFRGVELESRNAMRSGKVLPLFGILGFLYVIPCACELVHGSSLARFFSITDDAYNECTDLEGRGWATRSQLSASYHTAPARFVAARRQNGLFVRHSRHHELGPGRSSPACAQEEEIGGYTTTNVGIQAGSPSAHG